MKVGIEGTPLFSFSGKLNGVGQYAKYLIEACVEEDSDTQYEVIRMLMPHRKFIPPLEPHSNLSYRVVRWLPPVIYYQAFKRLGWAPPYDLVALRKYDIFIFFNFVTFPLTKKTKSLLFIYDLSFIRFGQYSSPKNKTYMDKYVPLSLKKTSNVVTISEFSKGEISKYYGFPAKQISVVTPAIDHDIFYPRSKSSIEKVKKKYRINGDYILSVCTIEPRKNLAGTLNAYKNLPAEIKKKYSLVLAGGKGWLDDELNKMIEDLASNHNVIRTGYVPDEELPILYSGASVFVFPSFYEGFGMPPLEAMACGVPVITSNNSSLPEVVGNAGIMVRAEDTARLTKEIERVLSDNNYAQSLRAKGLVRAQGFSWHKSAHELLKLLRKISSE
jgi:alpha-1,3-rhamnosyl/mannosyltransferase